MTHNVNVMSELDVLNAALQVGWVKFHYYKADGEHRIAIGTRNRVLIEKILGKRTQERRNRNYFENCNGYFDLIRLDWRQFNANRFIGMLFEKMSNEQAVHESIIMALNDDMGEIGVNKIMAMVGGLFPKFDTNKGVVVVDTERVNKIFNDSKREWCMRYNGGRGLNGVLLRAADNGGSGCLGWIGTDSKTERPSADGLKEFMDSHFVESKSTKRSELIAELMRLRERENEILAELLA